jgi:hypothetical protein
MVQSQFSFKMVRVRQSAKSVCSEPLPTFFSGSRPRSATRHCCKGLHISSRASAHGTTLFESGRTFVVAFLVLLLLHNSLEAQNTQNERLTRLTTQIPVTSNTAPGDLACAARIEDESQLLTDEQQAEWKVGKKLSLRVAEEETLEYDPVLTGYLNKLEQRLVHDSALRGCFVVQLIVDKEQNAYSLPGGFIYLTTGLAMKAEREGELVAALAHETGHVVAHHFARIEHKRKVGHHFTRAGGPAGYLIAQFLGPIFMGKMMRNAEFEADRLCLRYQYASGYDPREFIRLLRHIDQQNSASSSVFSRVFDTHPSIAARLHRLDSVKERSPAPHTNSTADDSDFRAFKERLSSYHASR